MSAARVLFGRLIDHAPTFPPASLPVAEAIAEDRRARASSESWILARLAWPASRLTELGDEERELTVIVDGSLPDDPRVQAIEGRVDPAEVAGAAPEVYVEDADLDELAKLGLRAKIRCGGERVPDVEELAAFIRGCRDRGLAFKATAGLHHAVRQGDAHGFVNLLAASAFGDEEAALAEEDPETFAVVEDAFTWRGRSTEPAAARELFVGFGSCSFFEPVGELKALGLL